MFAFGMVLLEAMTLQPSETIYDPNTGFISGNYHMVAHEINSRIGYASQYYAPELCHIVRIFMALDPNMRPDCN